MDPKVRIWSKACTLLLVLFFLSSSSPMGCKEKTSERNNGDADTDADADTDSDTDVDTGTSTGDDEGLTVPGTYRKPDDAAKLAVFEQVQVQDIGIGRDAPHLGFEPGREEELPRGPVSFDVSENGDIVILDSVNKAVKYFSPGMEYKGLVDLGDRGSGCLDLDLGPNGELALFDAAKSKAFILPPNAKALAEASQSYKFEGNSFLGIELGNDSKLYIKEGDQYTSVFRPGWKSVRYLSFIVPRKGLYLRTRKLSSDLGMLYVSDVYQSSDFLANTKSRFEIALDERIGSVSYLNTDDRGRFYLHVETLQDGPDEVVRVKRYVIRVGKDPADWSKPLEIPVDVAMFPFRDLRVMPDGTVYAMLVYGDKVEVRRWIVQ